MCYSVMLAQDMKILQNRFGKILVRQDQDLLFETERVTRQLPWPPLSPRIFSGSFAPVCFLNPDGNLELELMRYSAYAPYQLVLEQRIFASEKPKPSSKLSTFNARRDNLLSPFWQSAFMKGHGFVALDRFYEWVQVADLLGANTVQLQHIEFYFAQKTELRKKDFESNGKKWKPTASELKDPQTRKVIIEFFDPNGATLWAPVIFNQDPDPFSVPNSFSRGFAIVTDEPLPEVLRAGHDRTPAFLNESDLQKWLDPRPQNSSSMLALLRNRPKLDLQHELERSA